MSCSLSRMGRISPSESSIESSWASTALSAYSASSMTASGLPGLPQVFDGIHHIFDAPGVGSRLPPADEPAVADRVVDDGAQRVRLDILSPGSGGLEE